jgi:hypothetical protein
VRRRIFTLASLLLCLAVLSLWIRSYFSYDLFGRHAYPDIGTELMSARGHLILWHWDHYAEGKAPPQDWIFERIAPASQGGKSIISGYDVSDTPHWWNRRGFLLQIHPYWEPETWLVIVPHWFLVLISVAVLFISTRHSKRPIGACQCGYNLTGNTSGVCPECGATVESPAHKIPGLPTNSGGVGN